MCHSAGTISYSPDHHRVQAKLGVDKGPIHLVEAGLPKQLSELGWQVQFDGHHQFEEVNEAEDPPIGVLKNPRLVSKVTKAVADVVGAHAKEGQLPVTIGGDHSLVSARTLIKRLPLIFVSGAYNTFSSLK